MVEPFEGARLRTLSFDAKLDTWLLMGLGGYNANFQEFQSDSGGCVELEDG